MMDLILLIGGAAACCAAFFAAFNVRPKLCVYETKSAKVSDEIRIAQVSDLHDCLFGKNQSVLVGILRESKPDIIVFTGDIVDDNPRIRADADTILPPCHPARILIEAALKIAPVYMVFGNHEANIGSRERLKHELGALGVRLLGGSKEYVSHGNKKLALYGIDDPYWIYGRFSDNPKGGFFGKRRRDKSDNIRFWRDMIPGAGGEKAYSVLLSHRPEEFEAYRAKGFDAAFSGHAHGGQWRLPPLINGLYAPHQGIFPQHAGGCYKYQAADGEFVHVVSRGLSLKRCPRIFNRPEICLLRILPEK